MILDKWPSCFILLTIIIAVVSEDYNIQHNDGSYEFGYDTPDSYHRSKANRNNVVRGEFGGRNPKTGGIDSVSYTAGPRGYRPRGRNIARKFDQNQNRRGPIGSRDDPYFDPNEDPSYNFGFKTRAHSRQESANRLGDVSGTYSYLDDVGERHNVEYIAGKKTGFHVKTPFPDSNPRAYGPLYFKGRGKPIPRGRTSIQRGLDGSYRFVSAGPDQRRTETSDSAGNVRGSYTYLDDKGVQHSVHYIAGPQIGYRVLKNVRGPHLPSIFPFSGPNIIPPDFYDYIGKNSHGEIFEPAASGRPLRPQPPRGGAGGSASSASSGGSNDNYDDDFSGFDNTPGASEGGRPGASNKPSYQDEDDGNIGDDLFGGGSAGSGSSFGSAGGGSTGSGSGSTTGSVSGGNIGAGTTSRPNDFGLDEDDDDEDDSDLFGEGGGGASRPSSGSSRPSGGAKPGGRPSGGARPGGRPSGTRPSSSRPSSSRPSTSTASPGGRPSYEDEDNDLDEDFGLFGGGGGGGSGVSSTKPPTIAIGTGSTPGQPTLVTNVGSTIFTVPPGVTVHAHVQSIDLFPFESKVPSPSEQYRAETSNIQETKISTRELNLTTTPLPQTTEAITTEKPQK